MKKLRLDLDSVVVESFATAADASGRGTVDGLAKPPAASIDPNGGECTIDGCSGDGACSWDIDCSVNQCSADCTGYPGCSGDGYCSEVYRCTGIGVCFWTP